MATQDQEVKLVGFWTSPFVHRVEWALKLKGVSYEYIEEDISNKTPLLLELNPVLKKVPVLVHNHKAISESLLILEYIDETWKQTPLLPQDPYERATDRFWSKFAGEKFLCSASLAMWSQEDAIAKEGYVKSLKEELEKIEGELVRRKTKFFGGESIGLLDLALGWFSTHWLPVWEEVGSMMIVDPVQFPATTAWMENFIKHPVIAEKLPDKSKMVEYFPQRREEIGALIAAGKFKI